MLLYESPVSGNCYKVRLLLAHLGVPYERRELDVVDRSDRREVLGELNPGLRVPTLVLDDGRPLGESGAILAYLAVVRFWVALSPDPPPDAEIEERRRGGYAALDAMERHLATREWFAAGRYTIADIALYAYTHVAPEGGFDLSPYAAVGAWMERVRAQPGHVPITA